MAVSARTKRDVDALEEALCQRLTAPSVRYLGDKEANWGEISSPADPTALVFERVTNMWDALLERVARRTGKSWPTPAAAAADILGVARTDDLTDTERDRHARLAIITLHDSDEPKLRPTLSFRDYGIGIGHAEMPDTILSLAGSNKLRKPYLHGIFGKGGSSACVFSDATIVISRKQPALLGVGEADLISIAVIREDDAVDVGLPFYRYWVGADRLPLAVPAAVADFPPGTLVIHINYQAAKMGLQQWQYEESIYAYAETLLFKPTLPYSLLDDRSPKFNTRPEDRRKPSTLSGLARRLENTRTDGLVQQSNWSTVAVPGVGDVRLRWWLFAEPDQRRRRAAKGYVVLFTTNGQVHHAWDQARLRQQAEGLRRVGQRIIVEVDCDGVDLKTRAKLFDAFRNQVRKGPEGKALEAAVADELAGDPDLEEHESLLTRQALRTSDQRVSEAFLRRLNRAVRAHLGGIIGTPAPGEGSRRPRPKKQIELHPEPTSFTGPSQITVLTGARASIYMSCDAVDGFVPDRGTVLVQPEEDAPQLAFGTGDLRRGRLRISVVATLDAQPGIYPVNVVLEWPRAAGGLGQLSWTVKLEVVDEIEPKPSGRSQAEPAKPSKGQTGDVAFLWSTPEKQPEWSDAVGGDLQEIRGSDLAHYNPQAYGHLKEVNTAVPTIVLNEEFREWAAYRRATAKRGIDLRPREERYGLAVGAVVLNLYANERKLRRQREAWEARPNGKTKPGVPMTDEQLQRAVAEAARGILVLMPDFDELMGDARS
jgi:hypothetical protein